MVTHRRRFVLGALATAPALSLGWRAFAEPSPSGEPLSVADFEEAARAKLPPAHFGYVATGADDDRTAVWNHDAYSHIEIRARRLVDVSNIDTTRHVFGATWKQPIFFSPIGRMKTFHPDGELAVARAAVSRGVPLMLSTYSSSTIEDVVATNKGPVWSQIYATDDFGIAEALVRHAEKAGCTTIVLTIDSRWERNNETQERMGRRDKRTCSDCHKPDAISRLPAFAGLDMTKVKDDTPLNLGGDFLKRFRRLVAGKLVVKGIVTAEDARFALRAGVDGVVVSNHGGRNEESLRSTIECLPEVVAAVGKNVPVLIDGGIRRGTDIFKALALGATAVGIGRPQVWGLAANGQAGVEAVDDILLRELRTIMRLAGTPTLAAIDRSHLAWQRF